MILTTCCPRSASLHWQILGWSSWHLQANGCEVIDLQNKQGWIQTKSVHPFYQLQVVFNNDDVRVASTKPQEWVTRSSMVVIPISQNH
jgi:hypothetical protein